MSLQFTKMHGLGNDYVYVSLFDQDVADPSELSRQISDRHRGVGSDGLILVGPVEKVVGAAQLPSSSAAQLRMQMFNSDGSRSQMCGNGIRCVAKLAYERGWSTANPMRIATDAGVLELRLNVIGGRVTSVRVDMGRPILEPARIPVLLPGERVVNAAIEFAGRIHRMTCVSVGNPHAVFFVPDLEAVPLREWGPLLEKHALFPQRINAHFVHVRSRQRVRMMTWERGAGATQACGTGASAVCVAGVLNDLTSQAITAELPGGELELEWDGECNHVFMTGPAQEVFTGRWP